MKSEITIKNGNYKTSSIYVHRAQVTSKGETFTEWMDTAHGRQQVTYTVDGEEKFNAVVCSPRQKPENATPQGKRNWLRSVGCDEEILASDVIRIIPLGSFTVDIPDEEFMQQPSVQKGVREYLATHKF